MNVFNVLMSYVSLHFHLRTLHENGATSKMSQRHSRRTGRWTLQTGMRTLESAVHGNMQAAFGGGPGKRAATVVPRLRPILLFARIYWPKGGSRANQGTPKNLPARGTQTGTFRGKNLDYTRKDGNSAVSELRNPYHPRGLPT